MLQQCYHEAASHYCRCTFPLLRPTASVILWLYNGRLCCICQVRILVTAEGMGLRSLHPGTPLQCIAADAADTAVRNVLTSCAWRNKPCPV